MGNPLKVLVVVLVLTCVLLTNSLLWAHEETHSVRLELPHGPGIRYGGYYAALWLGFYEQRGLEVFIKSPGEHSLGQGAVNEVVSAQAEFGVGSLDFLTAIDQGADLVLVSSIFQRSNHVYVGSGTRPLEGRLARALHSAVDKEFQVLFYHEGISLASLDFVPYQGGLDQILQGQVDAIPGDVLTTPWELESRGITPSTIRPLDYGVHFYGDSLYTRRDVVNGDPQMVAAFVEASLQGWRYFLENPGHIMDRIETDILEVQGIHEDRKLHLYQTKMLLDLCAYPLVELGHTSLARWQTMYDNLLTVGVLHNPRSAKDYIWSPVGDRMKELRWWFWLIVVVLGVSIVIGGIIVVLNGLLRREVFKKTQSLSKLVQEKETLVDELYHRTRNNMLVIMSLLDIKGQRSADPKVQGHFEQMKDRIATMASLQEFLYTSQNLTGLELGGCVQRIVDIYIGSTRARARGIEIHTELGQSVLPVELAMPLSLALAELLVNALTHGCPGPGGQVHVVAYQSDQDVVVEVRDQGPGIPDGISSGMNIDFGQGLFLVRILVIDQLHGRFTMERGFGTIARILVPLKIKNKD